MFAFATIVGPRLKILSAKRTELCYDSACSPLAPIRKSAHYFAPLVVSRLRISIDKLDEILGKKAVWFLF